MTLLLLQPSEARLDLSRSERRRIHTLCTLLVLFYLLVFLVLALVSAARWVSSRGRAGESDSVGISSGADVTGDALALSRQDAFRKLDEALFRGSEAAARHMVPAEAGAVAGEGASPAGADGRSADAGERASAASRGTEDAGRAMQGDR